MPNYFQGATCRLLSHNNTFKHFHALPISRLAPCIPISLTEHCDLDFRLVLARVVLGLDDVCARVLPGGHEDGQLSAVVLRVDGQVVPVVETRLVHEPGLGWRRLSGDLDIELERRSGVNGDVAQVRTVNVRRGWQRRGRACERACYVDYDTLLYCSY